MGAKSLQKHEIVHTLKAAGAEKSLRGHWDLRGSPGRMRDKEGQRVHPEQKDPSFYEASGQKEGLLTAQILGDGRKGRAFSLMDQVESERKWWQSKNPERCNSGVTFLSDAADFFSGLVRQDQKSLY